MSKALTSRDGAIFIQPDGPGGDVYFVDCKDLADLAFPEGGIELLRCFDPSGAGWKVVGTTQAPPDPITFSITGLMFKTKDWLEKVSCPFSMFILQRECGRPDNVGNYHRGFVLGNVTRTNRTYSNIVSREEEQGATFTVELMAEPPAYELEVLEIGRETTALTEGFNDVAFNVDERCFGDCGETQDACEAGLVVGESAIGPALADIAETTDDGETWTPAVADPFVAGLSAMAVVRFYVGATTVRYLVGETAPAGAQGNLSYTDDNGATWTNVTIGGAAAGHGPTYGGGLFALDEHNIWLASAAGYIYFSSDGGETWTIQDAGVVTVTDYSQIKFDESGQYGMAVAPADVIAVTTDGGNTWAAAGGNTGTGDDLLTVDVIDNNRAWVGTDEGNLYYTRDGGATWTQETGWPGSGVGDVRALKFVSELVGWMVYNTAAPVGHVQYTFDGGRHWTRIPTPANSGLNAISACNHTHAFAVGLANAGTGVILKVQPATA